MMICTHCGDENRVGELVCQKCGRMLADQDHDFDGFDDTKPIDVAHLLGLLQRFERIMFESADGQVCHVPVSDGTTVLLGRGTRTGTGTPLIDLSTLSVQGTKKDGVSRKHACIRVESDSVLLTDLGSTNGTYLNGRRLMPNSPHILHGGDTVLFGRLQARVIFA